jgi:hypothetical protein
MSVKCRSDKSEGSMGLVGLARFERARRRTQPPTPSQAAGDRRFAIAAQHHQVREPPSEIERTSHLALLTGFQSPHPPGSASRRANGPLTAGVRIIRATARRSTRPLQRVPLLLPD